tara:strand:+ start:207 stop:425 length:219 start_codon:yes stop_codon:yes gene_type:complete
MLKIIFMLITTSLLMTNFAYAYLDPGTGSFILQILAVIFASVVTFFKFFYAKFKEILNKIKIFFSNLVKRIM